MLTLCVPGAYAQQPNAPAPNDAKTAATVEVKAAEAQMQKARAQLQQRRRELDQTRRTGDSAKIDKANSAVRESLKQLHESKSRHDATRHKLVALEKPERDAAKARGYQVRVEHARRRTEISKAKSERQATAEKAQKAYAKERIAR
jgi:hypothetical protein